MPGAAGVVSSASSRSCEVPARPLQTRLGVVPPRPPRAAGALSLTAVDDAFSASLIWSSVNPNGRRLSEPTPSVRLMDTVALRHEPSSRPRHRPAANVAPMGEAVKRGESLHELGRQGARRAKQWLESTSRVDACWVNPDKGAADKLSFDWPQGGESFSFDLGGTLRYGDFHGQMFYAEVKKYANSGDLPAHYREFLAKCYVAYLAMPRLADNFMWISWSPHAATTWDRLTSADTVKTAVIANAKRVFADGANAEELADDEVCAKVAERLWLLVLSDKQEALVPDPVHLGLIHNHELLKASGS